MPTEIAILGKRMPFKIVPIQWGHFRLITTKKSCPLSQHRWGYLRNTKHWEGIKAVGKCTSKGIEKESGSNTINQQMTVLNWGMGRKEWAIIQAAWKQQQQSYQN